METLALIPREGATANQLFTELAKNFKLHDAVRDALINSQIENLDEFRFMFDQENKVDLWLQKLSLGDEKVLQGARLRRAWFAVRLYFQQAEQDRSKVSLSDLDSMLEETELRDTKVAFWRRYRQRYPADLHPSDATLSRVTRELTKRMLCVFSVWKVKSLQFQLHTTNRKRKLSENLFTEEHAEDDATPQNWETYLDKLHTLMIAYAMAGTSALPLSPLPAPQSDAALGADSTQFVAIPLDIVMAYFFRAKRTSAALPAGKRLEWLQARDTDERAEWVSKFRESTLPLGAVIKEIMTTRDAHWILAPAMCAAVAEVPSASGGGGSPPKQSGASQFSLGKPINGRPVAKVMKDGTKLCQAFQHGQCKSKSGCTLGQHRCGLVTKKERVCGSPGHGATTCRNSSKP